MNIIHHHPAETPLIKAIIRTAVQVLSNLIWAVLLFAALTGFSAEQVEITGSLAPPRRDHTATALVDGRVLILGGQNTTGELASAEIYQPATRSFVAAGV